GARVASLSPMLRELRNRTRAGPRCSPRYGGASRRRHAVRRRACGWFLRSKSHDACIQAGARQHAWAAPRAAGGLLSSSKTATDPRLSLGRMNRRSLLKYAGAAALAGCATPQTFARETALAADLDAAVARFMAANYTPGLAVAV